MFYRVRALALALLTLLLWVPPASPQTTSTQTPTPPQDEVFAESIDVNVVSIEVSVTDRRGHWVTGLTRDDFEVYEDGKPVEITYFYASEGTAGQRPEAAVPAPERLQLAVYFDLENLPPNARPQLATAVEDFLVSRAGPQEKVLLASYNGPDTLSVRELPASRPTLSAALGEIVGTRGLSPASWQEARMAALSGQMVGTLGGSQKLDTAMTDADADVAAFDRTAANLMGRMKQRSALAALEAFVANLGSRPGRKALLFVSGSISFRQGQSIVEAFETKLGPGARQGPLSVLVKHVEEAASSDRIAFYALGASGNVPPPTVSVRTTSVPESPRVIDRSRVLTDANTAASLAWIGEDLASYYSLGYTPTERHPGQRHRVEVKVKRRGLYVHSIEGYRERAPGERMRNRTAATLQMGGGENPFGLSVQMGQAGPEKKGTVTVPVTLEIPLSGIALLPGEKGAREGRLSILVTARDSKGRVAAVTEHDLPLQLDEPIPPGISYDFQLALRSAPHTIVLGVWDEIGNTLSTVTTHYDPGAR